MTVNAWLNIFLQLVNMDAATSDQLTPEESEHFVLPQYSSHAFVQIARVSF